MTVKATAQCTLSQTVDVSAVVRYYKLQTSTATKPSKPTTKEPSGWTITEPSYTSASTNSLYTCDRTDLTDGTWSWSDVSLSSSYEAAKAAYNAAVAAGSAAAATAQHFWADNDGAHVAMTAGDATTGANTLIDSLGMAIRNGIEELARFGAEIIELGKNSKNAIIKFCGNSGRILNNGTAIGVDADIASGKGGVHLGLYNSSTESSSDAGIGILHDIDASNVDTVVMNANALAINGEVTVAMGDAGKRLKGQQEVLWTNPDVTAAFPAQSITIDVSNHDNFLVCCYVDTSNAYETSAVCHKGTSCMVCGMAGSAALQSGAFFGFNRCATIASTGVVTFTQSAYWAGWAMGSVTLDDNHMIPYQIIGL